MPPLPCRTTAKLSRKSLAPPSSKNDNAKNTMALLEPGSRTSYLRAAQAYMLISMPTGTSTIFGAFQAISELQLHGTIAAPKQ
jgi:hypothetical protein